ncbi:hypothetical protein EW145_g4886 [Phellinidium pouzarii]|uniref:Uncharacterized protein n=1 Tax=Phellinidium pouzarii TaxID=167371 RepID=A0A4S4L3T7_9AGAM|nr:hypothetical protein EW145_g4886 [Phellinidium pouzarii]
MTAVMTPPAALHFMPNVHSAPAPLTVSAPRSGILLNASPCSSAPNSPKRTPYLLSPFSSGTGQTLSSHSSASSSTSSTDDFASSTSATSPGGTPALNATTSQHQQPSRKIRFAPLPEPRRDGYEDDSPLPSTFAEADSAASSPRLNFISPLVSPQIIPPTPTGLANSPSVSQLATSSCSTLGLSFDGIDPPDSGQATETSTIAGSECGTDETQTAMPSRKKVLSWTRLLRLPKYAPRQGTGAGRSTDEYIGIANLFRASSRESTVSVCSLGGFAASDANGSTSSLAGPVSRRKSIGADGAVSPAFSFRGGLPLKPVVSDASTAAAPAVSSKRSSASANAPLQASSSAGSSSAPPTVRRGTRLLNGRVYGARNTPTANPFATVRDAEPEFVEWGHGGMGSVKGARATKNASAWAALQSSQRLLVGHAVDEERDDDDDGSGMGWVRRRREQREREKKERERLESEKKLEMEGEKKRELSADASEGKEAQDGESNAKSKMEVSEVKTTEKETGEEGKSLAEKSEKQDLEHVYTAVTVPALKPKVHHHHSHPFATHSVHSAHSNLHASVPGNGTGSPITEHVAASPDFGGACPSPFGAVGVIEPSEGEGEGITSMIMDESTDAGAGTLTPTSTSSSSLDDSEDDGEVMNIDDADEEGEDEEDEDTEGREENLDWLDWALARAKFIYDYAP